MSNTTLLLATLETGSDHTATILGGVALGVGGLSALFLAVKHLVPPSWIPFLQKVLPVKESVVPPPVSTSDVVVELSTIQVISENVSEIKQMVQGLVKAAPTSETSE